MRACVHACGGSCECGPIALMIAAQSPPVSYSTTPTRSNTHLVLGKLRPLLPLAPSSSSSGSSGRRRLGPRLPTAQRPRRQCAGARDEGTAVQAIRSALSHGGDRERGASRRQMGRCHAPKRRTRSQATTYTSPDHPNTHAGKARTVRPPRAPSPAAAAAAAATVEQSAAPAVVCPVARRRPPKEEVAPRWWAMARPLPLRAAVPAAALPAPRRSSSIVRLAA